MIASTVEALFWRWATVTKWTLHHWAVIMVRWMESSWRDEGGEKGSAKWGHVDSSDNPQRHSQYVVAFTQTPVVLCTICEQSAVQRPSYSPDIWAAERSKVHWIPYVLFSSTLYFPSMSFVLHLECYHGVILVTTVDRGVSGNLSRHR